MKFFGGYMLNRDEWFQKEVFPFIVLGDDPTKAFALGLFIDSRLNRLGAISFCCIQACVEIVAGSLDQI